MTLLTLAIIGANVLISMKAFNDRAFFSKYEFHLGRIVSGEKMRMFTSAFLHVDWMHLFFNMLTFLFFSRSVEMYVGPLNMLLVYIGSLLLGNMITLLLQKNNYHYRAVGASGAVTGIVFASIVIIPDAKIYMPFPIPAYLYGMLYLFYSIYGMRSQSDNIGHSAHFGGALGGLLLIVLMAPELLSTRTNTLLLLALPIILMFVMYKQGRLR